ncbi:cyclic AMP-responsive element-binding protein 3-like protein 4 [Vombatus ursinus]|uniref:Cyclic AMP-responsive element-binding protein 3-like protein 4 n=1 Tax=Vombatus ursinus TaxID=29139 RepID=A0A4X2LDI7_VOMUR|nr:cyclic AMP-responsive element-binding protein 3-like protein 4 [Vombatus ursinus]XP_027727300.1 cyclic AMP-responsive element-binding protein 3-like protein 4 [Vombatus ursinus]
MELGDPELLDILLEPSEDITIRAFPELAGPSSFQEPEQTGLQDPGLEGWEPGGSSSCGLQESEPDDFLNLLIDPNEVYQSRVSPGSDSGISEEPGHPDSPPGPMVLSPPAFYEVVYETGALEGLQGETDPTSSGLISIQLGQWSPPLLIPDACIISEPPSSPPAHPESRIGTGVLVPPETLLHCPALFLTDEEKRLLGQEGVSLPYHLPLTKAEERVLKKVRRKIRNKQSAQDSRRRKKEYIDGLETRVAACSVQNQQLQKKLQELERHNVSLVAELQQLQALIAQTSNKAAQTSTCVLILILSLTLIILPSFSPFPREQPTGPDTYKPSGVISRNILTHKDVPDSLRTLVSQPGNRGVNGSSGGVLKEGGKQPGHRERGRPVQHADEM